MEVDFGARDHFFEHTLSHSESLVLRIGHDGAEHNCYSLLQLELVPKLRVQVNATQEEVELGVRVDPADRYQLKLSLDLKESEFIIHRTPVLLTFLPGNDQVRDLIRGGADELASQDSASLDFD